MINTDTTDVTIDPIIPTNKFDVKRERTLWVDYAKAIGIILVVYAHVARGIFNAGLNLDQGSYKLIDSVIYTFHMPLFFFLSGVFLLASMAKRSSMSLLRTKVDTIFYPYVVWSLLQGLIEVAMSLYVNGQPTLSEVFSFAWSPRAQFWFLYVLFFVFAFAMLVFRRSSLMWSSGIFIGSLVLYFFGSQLSDLYLFNTLSHYFVYFAAGVISSFLLLKLNSIETRWMILFLALFIFSQWVYHYELGLRYNSNAAFEQLLLGLIGICFVVLLAQWLSRFNLRWLTFLGRHSMTIYLVHILTGSGCRIILQKGFGVTDVGVHLVVGTLGGLLLPLVFYFGCMRFGLGALFSPPRALAVGKP
ncbi:MAG: acyltransferase [Sideroxyarcus sp.]|nr:acyltransferase [Sideroxyarcus sp.]